MPARGDGAPKPPQHLDAPGQVEQQQPRVHQVERSARDRLAGGEVLRLEVALAMARAVQHGQRHGAERGVRVDAQYAARGPDPLGHQAHGLARPAAGIQAAGARPESDLVQQPSGRGLPRAGLGSQPLVFFRGVPQRVYGLRPLGLDGGHG